MLSLELEQILKSTKIEKHSLGDIEGVGLSDFTLFTAIDVFATLLNRLVWQKHCGGKCRGF